MLKTLRVLSLGAGVQSSTLALMIHKGEIPMVDCAIFADTQAEPPKVYEWLEFIKKTVSYPVHIVTWRNLEKDVLDASQGKYQAFTIPFYTKNKETEQKGMLMRQCTADYKIKPVTKKVRELLGYKKGERVDFKQVKVEMLMGISTDEMRRMRMNRLRYIDNQYPLINDFGMSRQDCIMWIKDNGYPMPTKSACYFCPFHSQSTWKEIKENDPELFEKAVQMDRQIRDQEKYKTNNKHNDELYLHRSCEPLDKALEDDGQLDMFDGFDSICDEGMCGV
nr:putative PAPS reductase [uncultured Mediterranean phage uvMED]